jgi:hypothetical protein
MKNNKEKSKGSRTNLKLQSTNFSNLIFLNLFNYVTQCVSTYEWAHACLNASL